MQKVVKGICPVLNRGVDITINYHDASTFEGKCYVKGRFSCDYRKETSCVAGKCPIYQNAPENI